MRCLGLLTALAVAALLTPLLLASAALTALTATGASAPPAPSPATRAAPAPGHRADPHPHTSGATPSAPTPGAGTIADIPPGYLRLYTTAAASCPMDWAVLAAVGKIESNHGRSSLPGVASGSNPAGAQGPMQILPATFAAYSHHLPPGGAHPPDPHNPHDAVWTAQNYLCATGARHNHNLTQALWHYNHSTPYRNAVFAQAHRYRTASTPTPAPRRANPLPSDPTPAEGVRATVATAIAFARRQIGTPYQWGGDGAAAGEHGFDCSGLTRAAYAAAGIGLPRTAQTQYNAGPRLPAGTTPQPGDLVFYGTSPTHITHVGLATSPTHMINAPHAHALVRTEPITRAHLIGITRPTIR